jgi:hypothetical protein
MRERNAFVAGVYHGRACGIANLHTYADSTFPLPKIIRPRIVKDPNIIGEWRCVDGELQVRYGPMQPWSAVDYAGVTTARVRLWADLLANPTETVDDDSAGSSPDGQEADHA